MFVPGIARLLKIRLASMFPRPAGEKLPSYRRTRCSPRDPEYPPSSNQFCPNSCWILKFHWCADESGGCLWYDANCNPVAFERSVAPFGGPVERRNNGVVDEPV